MPLRLQLFCGHFSTRCQAMRICRTPHRINCSKRLAGGHEDYTGRIIPRVLHESVLDVFSQQLETVMMIADESGRFGDQYGQSFPQLGHKKVGFPCVSIMFEYLWYDCRFSKTGETPMMLSYLIFVIFSPRAQFFLKFFSTQKRVNCEVYISRQNSVNHKKTDSGTK